MSNTQVKNRKSRFGWLFGTMDAEEAVKFDAAIADLNRIKSKGKQ